MTEKFRLGGVTPIPWLSPAKLVSPPMVGHRQACRYMGFKVD